MDQHAIFYTHRVQYLFQNFRYMVTEVGARDLGDSARYNMLEVLSVTTYIKFFPAQFLIILYFYENADQ